MTDGTKSADGAMEFHELLGGHSVSSVENLAGAVIGLANFALLFVGESHDSQGENLVDLGSVKEVACAFGSNLRVVVQNDGRSQESISLSWFTHENWPRADVLTLRDEFLHFRRRFEQRDKFTVFHAQDQVG